LGVLTFGNLLHPLTPVVGVQGMTGEETLVALLKFSEHLGRVSHGLLCHCRKWLTVIRCHGVDAIDTAA
jgi:hypothetical protein